MTISDAGRKIKIWLTTLQTTTLRYVASESIPYYLVHEYPRSGGSWFSQMLSDYLSVEFPRGSDVPAPLKPSVLHGHYLCSDYFNNLFCIIRDGRDVMVSSYFRCLRYEGQPVPYRVRRHRRRVPFNDFRNVEENLAAFIQYMFLEEDSSWNRFRWDEFVQSCLSMESGDVAFVKYEDLLVDAAGEVGDACEKVLGMQPDREQLDMIEERYSFENQTNRARGEEAVHFMRKGVAGDWKSKFNAESCRVFDRLAGDELLELGYENDHDWVEEQAARYNRVESGR